MVTGNPLVKALVIAITSLSLNGCYWGDCSAPYLDDYVFVSNGNITLANNETKVIDFTFYPNEPYSLRFRDDIGKNPRIAATVHGPFESIVFHSGTLSEPNTDSVGNFSSEEVMYGPDNRLTLPIKIERMDDLEMKVLIEGQGFFVAPLSSEYIDFSISLVPKIDCFGDSGDTVYLSERVRIDLI